MFKTAVQKCCFLHDTHRVIYFTGKATTALSFNRKLYVKGNNSSSFLCGEEINFIVFEIIITTVCFVASLRHVKSCQLIKEQQSNSASLNAYRVVNGEVFHKQASRYGCKTFQAKVSAHFNSPYNIIAVLLILLLIFKAFFKENYFKIY